MEWTNSSNSTNYNSSNMKVNLNNPLTIKEIKLVILELPTPNILDLDGLTGEFYQSFKFHIISFRKQEGRLAIHLIHFTKPVLSIPQSDKNSRKRKLQINIIPHEYEQKNLNKILAKGIQQLIKELYSMTK